MCDGRIFSNGKPNPVRLVSAVVARKTAVQSLSRCEASMPFITTKPVRMPTRLIITCTQV
jgi:hypothetical protein